MTFAKYAPNAVQVMQIAMLKIMYEKNSKYFPSVKNERLSDENVEKVVNPPQNPTVNEVFNQAGQGAFKYKYAPANPKTKLPVMLTVNVENTMFTPIERKRLFDANLIIAPSPPPINTAK